MEFPVTVQFLIYSLLSEKGRVVIDNIHFRYSLKCTAQS